MTQKEMAEFDRELDVQIEELDIPYHFEAFLKNVFGTSDLDNICNCCIAKTLFAVSKHIDDIVEEMEDDDDDEGPPIGNN